MLVMWVAGYAARGSGQNNHRADEDVCSDLRSLGVWFASVCSCRTGGKKTLVRAIWSQGPLSLHSIFPSEGDTPGRDLDGLPRPKSSSRILAAHIEGQNRHVVGYTSAEKPAQVLEFYTKELGAKGWKPVGLDNEKHGGPDISRAYQRDRDLALLVISPDDKGAFATWMLVPHR